MNAVLQTVQNFGSVRFMTVAVIGVIFLAVIGFLSYRLTAPVMTKLYSGMTSEETNLVLTELGAMGVGFEIAENGTEIRVQSSDVLRVRMALAQKGLPSKASIIGYEIFDREQSLGTSNFVLNVNMIRALEGELSRTIGSLKAVKSARVHIVVPKRTLFNKNKYETTASVVINVPMGVGKEEVQAIKQMVSTSVPGLNIKRITVINQDGKVLARGSSEDSPEGAISAGSAEEIRQGHEARIKRTIETLLEQTVGAGKVQAEVSVEMEFDHTRINSESYDPDSQVARSVQTNEEIITNIQGDGGAVSVANNLPTADASGDATGSTDRVERVEEIRNFEISKTITSKITEIGSIKRLSVAVLVDGEHTVNVDGEGNKTFSYEPRTDEELAQIRTLIESAIGYSVERGDLIEVVNMPFDRAMDVALLEDDSMAWLKQDIDSIIKTVVIGIVAILAIILVIRPLVNRAFDVQANDLLEDRLIPEGAGGGGDMDYDEEIENFEFLTEQANDLDIEMIQAATEVAQNKKVNEMVDTNPEETLRVIRSWMKK